MPRPNKRKQLDLFGEAGESVPAKGRSFGPASVPDDLAALAHELPETIRLGTSSWSFPGWAGIVYDRDVSAARLAREGLARYARHPLLRTVGIDRTFYAPIAAETFAEYAAAVPAGFRFLVKAPSACTSSSVVDADGMRVPNARYLDPTYAIDEIVHPFVEGLGEKAGPLVFQFPPQGIHATREPERFSERLGTFLESLPRGPLYAVELRDRELLAPSYREVLRACGVRHCISLHTRMPGATEQWRLAVDADGPLIVRWMLKPGLGYEEARRRYEPFSRIVDEDPAAREALAQLSREHAERDRDVFVVASNKAEGSAPLSIFGLARTIAAQRR